MENEASVISRAELARQLGVSRTYIILLCQGKKKASKEMADRLAEMGLAANLGSNNQRTGEALIQILEHTTFNQGVTVSRTVRPISGYSLAGLLAKFLKARRQGISPRTNEFYKCLLEPFVNTCELTPESINGFLSKLTCSNGKNAYYRASGHSATGCIGKDISRIIP